MLKIIGPSLYFPDKKLSNEELGEIIPGFDSDFIFKKTGIRNRFISAPGQIGSDLGYEAAENLFIEFPEIEKSSIDFLLFCTEGLDYKAPTSAAILQDRLKLRTSLAAMDLPSGCTGFVNGLFMARALILSSQATNILFITADIPSTVILPDDPIRMIFGDAGAALVISADQNSPQKMGDFVMGTDGNGSENLIVRSAGTREPTTMEWLKKYEEIGGMPYGKMESNSLEILNFAIATVPKLVQETLEKNNTSFDEVDLFVFHQASLLILTVLRKKLKIPEEKFYISLENTGNTVSASIPIALKNAMMENKIKAGSKVLIAGFGIGYSWGATIIDY